MEKCVRAGSAFGALLLLAAAAGPVGCAVILGIDHEYVGGGGGGGSGAGGASSTNVTSSSGGGGVVVSSGSSSATGAGGGVVGPACGDGDVDPGEQCDDGNLAPLDGCSPTCGIESLDVCPGAAVPLAPGKLTIMGTTNGASGDSGGTCGGQMALDVVYAVTPSATGTLKINLSDAFQNVLYVRDVCASSALPAERACKTSLLGGAQVDLWVEAGKTYYVFVDGSFNDVGNFTLDLDLRPCGDGKKEGLEQCDDGNMNAADGCDGCVSCAGALETSDPSTHHCYLASMATASWAAARAACVAWGGDLVAVSSDMEASFLKLCAGTDFWVGGNDLAVEGTYTNSNGEPWFNFWSAGEPDNIAADDCVMLNCQAGGLADASCMTALRYVCERAPAK